MNLAQRMKEPWYNKDAYGCHMRVCRYRRPQVLYLSTNATLTIINAPSRGYECTLQSNNLKMLLR